MESLNELLDKLNTIDECTGGPEIEIEKTTNGKIALKAFNSEL